MNNNRKILCGAAALLVSAGFFGVYSGGGYGGFDWDGEFL